MTNKPKTKIRIRKTRSYAKPEAEKAMIKRPCMICKKIVKIDFNMRLCPECREKVSSINNTMS